MILLFNQLNDLSKCRLEEADKLKEIKLMEEEARELARNEKEKYEAAKMEAEYVKECAEREASLRKEAESKALHDVREKEKFENALVGPGQSYQEFTWDEILIATSSFSENLQIGKGAHGTVYRCSLHHTTAAVKVLHSKEGQITKEFQQEVSYKYLTKCMFNDVVSPSAPKLRRMLWRDTILN